jgi:DNA-binding XRE family transcriptional regulator
MKNTVRIERAVLALKIARHFGKPTDSIFQLDEND